MKIFDSMDERTATKAPALARHLLSEAPKRNEDGMIRNTFCILDGIGEKLEGGSGKRSFNLDRFHGCG
jgi:hypothetical protein